ncbi:hypothetical protein [Cellulomonas taurus]|uniref:hypothetical protein n=1 Tax=Cellulomonas taurus TaxID=2729175 RepID=UPI00145C6979|nr:hypothetical protein [Cellulomonas taurus]
MTSHDQHLASDAERELARRDAAQDEEIAQLAEEAILAEPYDPWDPEEHHDDGWEAA